MTLSVAGLLNELTDLLFEPGVKIHSAYYRDISSVNIIVSILSWPPENCLHFNRITVHSPLSAQNGKLLLRSVLSTSTQLIRFYQRAKSLIPRI